MKNSPVLACVKESAGHEPKWQPDSCWSLLVCAAAGISVIIAAGIGYSFGLLLPHLMEDFQATRQETAWIGTLHYASGCVLSPVGSYLTNRFSYRFTAMMGSLAGISGFLLASFSPKLWMLYITYGLLAGFGHITVISSSNLVILPYFVKWRSLGVGVVVSAPAIGTFVMTQLTQSLLNAFDWQWTVRGFSVLYLVCGLCSTLFVPLNKQREESTNNKKRQEEERTSLFRNRSFLILLASLTVVHLSYYVPNVHIVKHCAQELHIPGKKSSMLFTYFAITSAFSRCLFCKLGDLKYFNRFHLYQGGMTISGLCVLCLPLARSFGSIVAIFVVNGLMDGTMQGQISLMVLQCIGKHNVIHGWGYTMFFTGLTTAIGPPLAGLMADKLGSYAAAFYTSGAVLIAGASITSLMACVKKRQEKSETQSYSVEKLLVTEKITVL